MGEDEGVSTRIDQSAEWQALADHALVVERLHLRDLFASDESRGERLTRDLDGVYVDFSKNLVTDETLTQLTALAARADLPGRIDAMFRGERINVTEGRPVLHVALRAPEGTTIDVDGVDVVPEVHAVLNKMGDFAARVRAGEWTGATGRKVRNVVNIGIGGSDLGP